MFISPAHAQAVGGGEPGMLGAFLPIVLIFVVFWFLLIRPQQKKVKQHRAMVDALRRGDKVVTGGGLIGTVAKVQDNEVQIDLAENVRVKVIRHTIQEVVTKPEPAKGKDGDSRPPRPANDQTGGGFSLSKLLGGGKKAD